MTTPARTVYEYEVELKLTNKNNRSLGLVTRVEWAYSVQDAAMQACLNQTAVVDTSAVDIELMKIGPPAEVIRQQALKLAEEVHEAIEKLKPKPNIKEKQ